MLKFKGRTLTIYGSVQEGSCSVDPKGWSLLAAVAVVTTCARCTHLAHPLPLPSNKISIRDTLLYQVSTVHNVHYDPIGMYTYLLLLVKWEELRDGLTEDGYITSCILNYSLSQLWINLMCIISGCGHGGNGRGLPQRHHPD